MAKAGFRPVIATDKVSTFAFTPSQNESQISSSASARIGGDGECSLHRYLAICKQPRWWAECLGHIPVWLQESLQQ